MGTMGVTGGAPEAPGIRVLNGVWCNGVSPAPVGGLDIGAALEQEGCSMIIGAIPSYFAYERNRSRTPVTAASTSRSQTWPMVWTMGLICF